MARRTLDAMAAGGIHDQLGGGFARYATDAVWLVPHFEKMLYDNAQLARVYVQPGASPASARYARSRAATLDFMARELRHPPGGGFAASLDADTEGEEGATYVWTAAEVGDAARRGRGAFRGRLRRDAGRQLGGPCDPASRPLGGVPCRGGGRDGGRGRATPGRGSRPSEGGPRRPPATSRDDKVLTAWNGLALAAFADAGWALDEPRYTEVAREAATFLWEAPRGPDGRLRRSWKEGRALHAGVLEDYTHLAEGMLALYEATFEERWFGAARELIDAVLTHFADPAGGFHRHGR